MTARTRALFAVAAASAFWLGGLGPAGAAPPQSPSHGAPTAVGANVTLPSLCQKPPTQPPLPYDKNACCKKPDAWQQSCLDWADKVGSPPVCLSPVYLCEAPAHQ